MDKIINNAPVGSDSTLTDSGFYWLEKGGVKVLVCKPLEDAGFTNGFSTRLGGVSPFPENDLNLAGFGEDSDMNIAENRGRFLAVFGKDYNLTTVWQVHSDLVRKITGDGDLGINREKQDGMVSNLEGVLLGVKTADCVPVLIGDPETRSFASIHAGWRGTVESIVPKAIRMLRDEYGAEPLNLIAAIGPAAGCESYEIGQEVIDAFEKNFSTSGKLFKETRPGHALIDLHLANREQLIAAGVNPNNIYAAPYCTMERTDLFFSYRVEKKKYGKTGRLMSVIGRSRCEKP
ncbi:MAG: peptidoglycan editing factor PgeF [Pyrinomonadaceae bacterium]|nr:peptidoglycan editing factor PgeF [Pyrinomonadaceae bacterium]